MFQGMKQPPGAKAHLDKAIDIDDIDRQDDTGAENVDGLDGLGESSFF